MKRMWSKDELGGNIYQHIITIADVNEDLSGTFLLISTSSAPINSVRAIPIGIVMNGLGIATLDGNESTSSYGIKKDNGKIDFKGAGINGGAYNETSQTIIPSDYESYSLTDVVTKI